MAPVSGFHSDIWMNKRMNSIKYKKGTWRSTQLSHDDLHNEISPFYLFLPISSELEIISYCDEYRDLCTSTMNCIVDSLDVLILLFLKLLYLLLHIA